MLIKEISVASSDKLLITYSALLLQQSLFDLVCVFAFHMQITLQSA